MKHYCAYHDREEPVEGFRTKKSGKLDSWCVEGRREYGRKYSAKKYALVKEANSGQKEATRKTCTSCKEEKPVGEFPERGDRPGKRRSECKVCYKRKTKTRNRRYNIENYEVLAEKKKKYHEANPRYNSQSSRNRRARLREARSESFSNDEVRLRDEGKCWFCGEFVDPEYEWPHPKSEVVHHLHPIAKRGPNLLKNVALAHRRCNDRVKDSYDSPFHQWRVDPIGSPLARETATDRHYLKRPPNVSFAYGLFSPDNDLCGIATFGTPSSQRIAKSACPDDPKAVIEFNRLWIEDSAPFGAASWFVSKALRGLPPYIVVSYADTGAQGHGGEPHHGGVYKALSFHYAGMSRSREEWRLPGSTRNSGRVPGAEPHTVTSKHRYWTVTGDKASKRMLRTLCEWPVFPYE